MDPLTEFFNSCCDWLTSNWHRIVFLAIGVLIVYLVYRLLAKQISSLKEQGKLEESVAFGLNRAVKWVSILVVLGVVVFQLGFDIGLILVMLLLV